MQLKSCENEIVMTGVSYKKAFCSLKGIVGGRVFITKRLFGRCTYLGSFNKTFHTLVKI